MARNLTWMMAMAMVVGIAPSAHAGKLPNRLVALTPEQVAGKIARSDAGAHTLTLSTEAAHRENRLSPIRHMLPDNHLRAVIDPANGAVRYEVHQSLFYWGGERQFTQARIGEGGATPLRADRAGGRFCPNEDNWGPCALHRQISFAIDEQALRTIAAGHMTAPADGWRFRIEERDGRHWDGAIAPVEAAGLLLAVERARIPG